MDPKEPDHEYNSMVCEMEREQEEIDGQIDPDQCREHFCAYIPGIGCQPCAVDLRAPAAA